MKIKEENMKSKRNGGIMYKRLIIIALLLGNIIYGIYNFNNKVKKSDSQVGEKVRLKLEKLVKEFELARQEEVEVEYDILEKEDKSSQMKIGDFFDLEKPKKVEKKKFISKPKPKVIPLRVPFKLLGIMLKGESSNIMLKHRGEIHIMSEKETIDNYRIDEIREKSITVSKGEKKAILKLNE